MLPNGMEILCGVLIARQRSFCSEADYMDKINDLRRKEMSARYPNLESGSSSIVRCKLCFVIAYKFYLLSKTPNWFSIEGANRVTPFLPIENSHSVRTDRNLSIVKTATAIHIIRRNNLRGVTLLQKQDQILIVSVFESKLSYFVVLFADGDFFKVVSIRIPTIFMFWTWHFMILGSVCCHL